MKKWVLKTQIVFVLAIAASGFWLLSQTPAQQRHSTFAPLVPRVWDDEAIATIELPLADPVGSPKHISSDYYYRIPVRPIYKSYPVYAPGHEPPRYLESLKQKAPAVLWDESAHKPNLRSKKNGSRPDVSSSIRRSTTRPTESPASMTYEIPSGIRPQEFL